MDKRIAGQRKHYKDNNPFLMFLGLHGVHISLKKDITGDIKNRLIPSWPPFFRKEGLFLDDLAAHAVECNFITQINSDNDMNGHELSDMVRRCFDGEIIYTLDHLDY